jgi:hypothetical protein
VADADRPDHRIAVEKICQIAELTLAAAHRDVSVVQNRDPGGIIAPVLELSQAFQDQRRRIPFADIADDAAHYFFAPFMLLRFCSVQPSRTRSWRSLKASAPAGTS